MAPQSSPTCLRLQAKHTYFHCKLQEVMSKTTAALENNSIYVIINLRPPIPGFHWGIFIPIEKPRGRYLHYSMDERNYFVLYNTETSALVSSPNLCMAIKVGNVSQHNRDRCTKLLETTNHPGPVYVEGLGSRVWVEAALTALVEAGIINLSKDVPTTLSEMTTRGEENRKWVETYGKGSANVINVDEFYEEEL